MRSETGGFGRRSSEQTVVLERYLRGWRSVNAEIRSLASVSRSLNSALAVAALITAAPTSVSKHGALSDPATPECERAVVHERAQDGLRTPRTQIAGNRTTVFSSAPVGTTLITVAAASTPTCSPPPTPRSSTPRVSDLVAQLVYVAAQCAQAAARARAARSATRALRARSLARRFRPTAARSGAAVDIACVARSFLSRRHSVAGEIIVLLLLSLLID